MTLAFIGDLHSDRMATTSVLECVARDPHLERIIQVGDLNYFPGGDRGEAFLDAINETCADIDVTFEFIDGNHDNHEALADLERDDLGRGIVRDYVRYLPRGYRFVDGGLTFLAFGGAVSIDRWLLTPGHNWWPGEMPTYSEYARAIEAGPADVIIAHERPLAGPPRLQGNDVPHIPSDVLADAHANARAMMDLARSVGAKTYVHGHHHVRYSDTIDGLRLEGLGMNGQPFDQLAVMMDDVTHTLYSPVARSAS